MRRVRSKDGTDIAFDRYGEGPTVVLVGADALADPSNTKTVRVRGGVPAVTDGPFAEAKEHLGGYLVVDCETIERATEIAARWPNARFCAMEVRPIMDEAGTEM